MKCKVDDCERDAVYKEKCVCQKHYFRMMRYGTYETTRVGKAKDRIVTPNGYIKIYRPNHEMSDKRGYAFEHRYNLFEKFNGSELECEKCGAYWNWRPYKDHVDHKDNNKENNDTSNLRPLCNACNTRRTKRVFHKESGRMSVTYKGETKTPEEWSRDDKCTVSGHTISRRIRKGQTAYEAIFSPSRTIKKRKFDELEAKAHFEMECG
jgi:hypothetical protein